MFFFFILSRRIFLRHLRPVLVSVRVEPNERLLSSPTRPETALVDGSADFRCFVKVCVASCACKIFYHRIAADETSHPQQQGRPRSNPSTVSSIQRPIPSPWVPAGRKKLREWLSGAGLVKAEASPDGLDLSYWAVFNWAFWRRTWMYLGSSGCKKSEFLSNFNKFN